VCARTFGIKDERDPCRNNGNPDSPPATSSARKDGFYCGPNFQWTNLLGGWCWMSSDRVRSIQRVERIKHPSIQNRRGAETDTRSLDKGKSGIPRKILPCRRGSAGTSANLKATYAYFVRVIRVTEV